MKVIVAGGTGLLGGALTRALVGAGHDVVVLTRFPPPQVGAGGPRMVAWDGDGTIAEWAYELDGASVVVNLTGTPLDAKRWTVARKEVLRSSRLLPTRSLVTAIRIAKGPPPLLIQGTAVGFYGSTSSDRVLDETAPVGTGFLAQLVSDWEDETHSVSSFGCRAVFARSGVVLATGGGALGRIQLPFRLFVGGPIGSGRQYLSWIHIDDWTSLMLRLVASTEVTGPFNLTAPAPVTYRELARAVGHAMHRPSWLPVPGLALRVAIGQMADEALLGGQRAVPARAEAMGFTFTYPTIDLALSALIGDAGESRRAG